MGLAIWCLILDTLVGFVGFVGFADLVDSGWLWTFPCCCFVGYDCRVVVNMMCYYGMSKYVVVCNFDYCWG